MNVPYLTSFFKVIFTLSTAGLLSCTYPEKEAIQSVEDLSIWQKEWARLDSLLNEFDTDFEKTTFLRQYCGRLTDIGRPTPAMLAFYQSVPFDALELPRFFAMFKTDTLPAACGVTSNFYIKLVQSFGYKAYQYSFGFTKQPYSSFIHSFPLVEINYEGEKRLIVQDPYLDLTFKNTKSEPIDFYEFLARLKQKQYEAVAVDTQSVNTWLVVADTALYLPYLNDSCKALLRKMVVQPDRSALKKIPFLRNYESLMQSPCAPFELDFTAAMHAQGYIEPFMYAYTLRASEMEGSADVKMVQTKVDSILGDTIANDFVQQLNMIAY